VLGLATDAPAEAVQAPTEEPEQVDWADVQRKIISTLQSDEVTYCETADIADVVGVEPRRLSQHLENMHARGEICKAYVAQRAGQKRATLVLWSINADVYK
jgi:predicted ArsR family transcriptional regulator